MRARHAALRGPKAASHRRVVDAFIGPAKPHLVASGNHRRQASATEPREGNTGDAVTMSIQTRERGTGTICAEHPTGRSGKLNQSPFPFGLPEELGGLQAMVPSGTGPPPPRRSLPGRQPRRGATGTRRSLPTATHKNRKRPDPRAKTPGQRALLDTGPWGQLCRYL